MASGYLALITWQLRLPSARTRLEGGDLPVGARFFFLPALALKHHSGQMPRQSPRFTHITGKLMGPRLPRGRKGGHAC